MIELRNNNTAWRFTVGVMVGLILFGFSAPALANEFDAQINALQQEIAQQQSQANALNAQADTLNNKVAALNLEINAATNQLQLTAAQLDKTNADLEAAKAKMQQQKDALAENIKLLYQQSSISSLEVLASSENFSDFMDKQQYLHQFRDKIEETVGQIAQLKLELEAKQQELGGLVAQQRATQSSLRSQRAVQAELLEETQGQEANYQQLVASNNPKLQAVIAARAAAVRSGELTVSGGGCGPYPDRWCNANYNNPPRTIYGYPARQCTSYSAWRRDQIGKPLGGNWGNAGDWMVNASSSSPQVGDVAVWPYGHPYAYEYGHVAVVEGVSGNDVTISQYNFDYGTGPGKYSLMTASVYSTFLQGVRYIR